MKRLLVLLLAMLSAVSCAAGDREKDVERVEAANTVLDEIMSAPDARIPDEVIDSAKCIAVVPSLLKGGFIVGGAYGKGVATCRTSNGWSGPAFFKVEGGSVGFQIGGQAVDYVMLIMNDRGMRNLLSSKFKLGADASAAAGPVGRHAEAATDWKMRAEVLTYSRARGLFAGVSLNGAVITQDRDDTRDFYGRMVPFRTILSGQIPPPDGSQPFLTTVAKYTGTFRPTAYQPRPSRPAATSPTPSPPASPQTSGEVPTSQPAAGQGPTTQPPTTESHPAPQAIPSNTSSDEQK